MRKSALVAAIVIVLLAAVAAVSNPSAETHRAKIKQLVAERSPVAGLLGIGALTAFISTYHSLGVASYTVVNGRTITVGAFGIVILVDQD